MDLPTKVINFCRDAVSVRHPPPSGCPGYNVKQSDGEASTLELWEYGVPLHCHCFQVLSDPEW